MPFDLLAAIIVLVILGLVLIVPAYRRHGIERSLRGPSRRTIASDRAGRRQSEPVPPEPAPTGREIERRLSSTRHQGALVPAEHTGPVTPWHAPEPDQVGVNRRQFLNRGIIGAVALGTTAFSGALLAYLWPAPSGGFGSKLTVGSLNDIRSDIQAGKGFDYVPEGRMWVVPYPASSLLKARAIYSPAELSGMEQGVLCLYQKCVHLGCRVPACLTSQWFECPCHGSQYNHVGEKKGGPAPRGLDRFAMSVSGGVLTADTGNIILGPPIGTDTTGQEPEGPHCVSGGE